MMSRKASSTAAWRPLRAVQAALAQWRALRMDSFDYRTPAGTVRRAVGPTCTRAVALVSSASAAARSTALGRSPWLARRPGGMKLVAAEGPGRGILAVQALAAARGEGELEQLVLPGARLRLERDPFLRVAGNRLPGSRGQGFEGGAHAPGDSGAGGGLIRSRKWLARL